MKKILLALAALAVLGLSATAQETPPIRGDFPATELGPFVETLWSGTGSAEGSARQMFDALDNRANLRNGLMKKNLKGQSVYWEHYALSASIKAHRPDSTEVQDTYHEGAARHTGYSYKTKESQDATHYAEYLDFMDEGFCSIWTGFERFDSKHKKGAARTEKGQSGSASVEIWYTPLKVHVKSVETVVPVYKGYTGAMDILLTDLQDRWCVDGYTFKVSSMNTGIFTVEEAEVTTGGDGKARIRLHGVEKGTGRLRVYLYLAQPENNAYVEVEEYLDVEVLEPEKWTFTLSVHDQFTLPAQDYTMNGGFSVAATLGEDDLPRWIMLDIAPVTRSGSGSFHAQGEFLTPAAREDGVVMGFDIMGILGRTGGAVDAHIGLIGEGIQYAYTGQAQTTDSKNVITALLMLLEEGSWPYRVNLKTFEQLSGASVSAQELHARQQQEQEDSGKKKKKKDKEKKIGLFGALKELNQAMKELDNIEIPDMNALQANSSAMYRTAYSPQQAQAKAAQVAYIKEHHCLVFPDVTQLLLPHYGNLAKEAEKTGPGGDVSWKELNGTLTLHKEN